MVRTLLFVILVFSGPSIAQQKTAGDVFGKWHETHGVEKFPCMNTPELNYFTRLISIGKNDEKNKILVEHRKNVAPTSRTPASVTKQSLSKHNFICPPFRGVRNPYPQVKDFGTASQFERIRIETSHMQIIDGLSKNQKWPHSYNPQKGYFEGKTPRGTPMNIIPILPAQGEQVRFVVQYLIWQDKTPPSLTLCYREDLHKQCNPYPAPEISPQNAERAPANVKKVGS